MTLLKGIRKRPGGRCFFYACFFNFLLNRFSNLSAASLSADLRAWLYMFAVVVTLAWPALLLAFVSDTPWLISSVILVCRNPWKLSGGRFFSLMNLPNLTLLQMCRWFGYRPRYQDLCRIYMSQASIDCFGSVLDAVRDLGVGMQLLKSCDFQNTALGELENYQEGRPHDLALVCCGLRIFIEKQAYDQLTPMHQNEFLSQWELEVNFMNRKPIKIYGSNKYPVHWDKFIKAVNTLGFHVS